MEYSKLPAEFSQSSPEIHAPEEFPATTVGKKKKKSKRSAGIMAILAGFLTVSLYFDVMLPFDMGAAATEPEDPTVQDTQPTGTPSTDNPEAHTVTIDRVSADGTLEDWAITNVYDESTYLSDGLQLRVLYAFSGCCATTLRDFAPYDYPYIGAYQDTDGGKFTYDYQLIAPYEQWDTYSVDGEICRKAGGGYYNLPDGSWFFGDSNYGQSFFILVGDPGTVPELVPESTVSQDPLEAFNSAINLLRWWAPSQDVAPGESFGAKNILDYTAFQTCSDEYGEKLVTEGDYSYYVTYAIPADVFEAAAADRFATVDADQLRSVTGYFYDQETQTSDSNFQFYQPDRDVYLFPYQGGWGDPSHYEMIGYTENDDGTYTVYSTFVDIYGDEAPEGEEGVDYLVMDGTYWSIESHLQTVVALSGDTVQFHSWQVIDAIPDISMIQPQ